MTKQELILLLKKYKENKAKLKINLKELSSKRIELKRLENIDTSLSATSYNNNSDIHSKNQISDKVGNKVATNEDKKAELREEIAELELKVQELRDKVEAVDDRLEALTYKEKELLSAYYTDNCSYYDIGNRVYYNIYHETRGEDAIKKIIEKAMKKIENL